MPSNPEQSQPSSTPASAAMPDWVRQVVTRAQQIVARGETAFRSDGEAHMADVVAYLGDRLDGLAQLYAELQRDYPKALATIGQLRARAEQAERERAEVQEIAEHIITRYVRPPGEARRVVVELGVRVEAMRARAKGAQSTPSTPGGQHAAE